MSVENRAEVAPAPTSLRLEDFSVRYDSVVAVDHVSFTVETGEIVALLGANGAGKSSLLAAVSGLVPTATGSVRVGDLDLAGATPQARARHVAHVPEGRRLFGSHTVAENLAMAAFGAPRRIRQERMRSVCAVLPRLDELADRAAFGLSGGEQQMVALGRGLMSQAQVLMIDELSLGLAPLIADQFAGSLTVLRDRGYAILLVEQYVSLALQVSDRVITMDRGRVVAQNTPEELRRESAVLREAYLGGVGPVVDGPAVDGTVVDGPAVDGTVVDGTGAAPDAGDGAEALDAAARPAPATPTSARARWAGLIGALVGGLGMLGGTVAPWLHYDNGSATGTLSGWDLPRFWAVAPLALAWLVVAGVAVSARSRRGLPASVGALLTAAGAGALAIVMTRVWLLAGGLPYEDAAAFSRAWGLLVMLYAGVLVTVAAARTFQQSTRRRLGRAASPGGSGDPGGSDDLAAPVVADDATGTADVDRTVTA